MKRSLLIAVAILVASSMQKPAFAQVPAVQPPVIAVTGNGESKGKPTVIEISASLSGEAELTADALVKYRDTRQRAVSALEALKIPGLMIDSSGYAIGQSVDPNAQQMAMRGMAANAASAGKVAVTEQLKLKITDADKLDATQVMDHVIRLLDAARDAGLVVTQQISPYQYQMGNQMPGIVKFKIPDRAVIRDKAYETALADARKKAEKIAELSGVKLGAIRSVRETDDSESSEAMRVVGRIYGGGMQQAKDDARELVSDKFAPIDLQVTLSVEFDIAAK